MAATRRAGWTRRELDNPLVLTRDRIAGISRAAAASRGGKRRGWNGNAFLVAKDMEGGPMKAKV